MTACNILEIDTELEWLLSFNDLFLREIEDLKMQKIKLYHEQSTVTS